MYGTFHQTVSLFFVSSSLKELEMHASLRWLQGEPRVLVLAAELKIKMNLNFIIVVRKCCFGQEGPCGFIPLGARGRSPCACLAQRGAS